MRLCSFVAFVAIGAACADAKATSSMATTSRTVDDAATLVGAIVRSINDAAAKIYVLRSLRTGTPVGASEPCMTPANRVSHRPSALANPPYAEVSIAQRERLVRAIGAFAIANADLTRNASASDTALALAEFERAAFSLKAVANLHAQGDVFVDRDANELFSIATSLRETPERAAREQILTRAAAIVDRLIGIVANDVTRRRREAVAITREEVDLWSAYAGGPTRAVLVPCNRPIASVASALAASPAAVSASSIGQSPAATIPTGLRRAHEREATLEALDLDAFASALHELGDASARSRIPTPEKYLPLR